MDRERYQVLISARLGLQFVNMVASLVLVRILKPEGVGTVGYAVSYVALFQTFSDLGFGTAHIKRVSEGRHLGRCVGTFLLIKSVLPILAFALIAMSLLVMKTERITPLQISCIWILGLSMIIESLARVPLTTFSARKESAKQVTGEISYSMVVTVARLVFAAAGASLVWQAWSIFFASVAMLAALGWLSRRSLPLDWPQREDIMSYTVFAMPFLVVGLLSKLVENLDVLMIGWFCGPVEVGHYTVALSVARNLLVFASTAGTLLFPTLSRVSAEGQSHEVQRITLDAERMLSLLLVPVAVFVSVDSLPMARLLWGKDFVTVTPAILAIVVWYAYFWSVTQPYVQFVPATGRAVQASILGAAFLGLNLTLNVLLIPEDVGGFPMMGLGAKGAAISCVSAMFLGGILYRIPCRRQMGTYLNRRILLHLLAGLCAGAATIVARQVLSGAGLWAFARDGFVVAAVYVVTLTILREVGREDYRRVLRWLNPLGIGRYWHSEIRETGSHE